MNNNEVITLSNLEHATSKQVFNQVRNHLLTQGERSVIGMTCKYRADNGLKCAAGCLIADEEYEDTMEKLNWYGLVSNGFVPNTHERLISELQFIHDCLFPTDWKKELEVVSNLIAKGEFNTND